MNRLTKAALFLLSLMVALGLSACGGNAGDASKGVQVPVEKTSADADNYVVFEKTLPDGRTVGCIGWEYSGPDGKAATLECDFQHSKAGN